MTPEQKIKRDIIINACIYEEKGVPDMPTGEKVDEVFDSLSEEDEYGNLQDATEEIRSGYDEETDISCEFSRHYEAKSVARKMSDGSWVGWTYWYGGGKHGEPESIDWMDSAYDLDCKEEQKMVTVRTFEKKNP